ncbi:MAG: hypothetical protein JWQ35_183, partial [Bacteriovoracaceae bacterium]|nr:hypothetical protein [Bacteriovoracaceae bacterium]
MIRGFNQAIFQIFVISLSFLLVPKESFSQTSTRLNCFEFQSILHFVEQQHLRFETMGSQEKSKLFDVALSETPDALRILGYPMLAARFAQMNFSAAIPTQNKTTAFQMCEAMASTTFRAAFLKAFTKHLDPYSDFYLTEELDTKSSALEGEFVGVGIGTESEDGALRVTEVVAGGPAE